MCFQDVPIFYKVDLSVLLLLCLEATQSLSLSELYSSLVCFSTESRTSTNLDGRISVIVDHRDLSTSPLFVQTYPIGLQKE